MIRPCSYSKDIYVLTPAAFLFHILDTGISRGFKGHFSLSQDSSEQCSATPISKDINHTEAVPAKIPRPEYSPRLLVFSRTSFSFDVRLISLARAATTAPLAYTLLPTPLRTG